VSFLSKGMIGPFFSYQQMRHLYYFRKCHWLHGFTWFYHHVFLVRLWFTVNIAIQRGYSLWTKIMNSLRPNVASDKVRMAIERDQASIHWWGGLCYPSVIKHGNWQSNISFGDSEKKTFVEEPRLTIRWVSILGIPKWYQSGQSFEFCWFPGVGLHTQDSEEKNGHALFLDSSTF